MKANESTIEYIIEQVARRLLSISLVGLLKTVLRDYIQQIDSRNKSSFFKTKLKGRARAEKYLASITDRNPIETALKTLNEICMGEGGEEKNSSLKPMVWNAIYPRLEDIDGITNAVGSSSNTPPLFTRSRLLAEAAKYAILLLSLDSQLSIRNSTSRKKVIRITS